MSATINFGIIGGGWRSEFYLRIARELPRTFGVSGVVVRDAKKGAEFEKAWQIPTFRTSAELFARHPDFVVASVPWTISVDVIEDCVESNMPVLAETPPAPDLVGLHRLAPLVESGARVQVAEQYTRQPLHAARLQVARSGRIGTVSQAQISSAHGYHGISLIRHYLDARFASCTVTARRFTSKIIASPGRSGPPTEEKLSDSEQIIAHFVFDTPDGPKLGVYDFTGGQYFSYIRAPRVLVRGERGEIVGEQVTSLIDARTPVTLPLLRQDAGQNGNLEGYFHKGYTVGAEWAYQNPFVPGRLSDDEIAIASLLSGMERYLDDKTDGYPLAQALQDRYLDICVEAALTTGKVVQTERQAWAR